MCNWKIAVGLLASYSACLFAQAQTYPAKPIRLMVPFGGGASGVELTARLFAPKLSEQLGQSMFIEKSFSLMKCWLCSIFYRHTQED